MNDTQIETEIQGTETTIAESLASGAERAFASFAGQGGDAMTQLEELWSRPGPGREFVKRGAAVLEAFVDSPRALCAGLYAHGLSLVSWITDPETRPSDRYLDSSPISHPLNFIAQVALWVDVSARAPRGAFAATNFVAATGHSQGVWAALLVSESLGDEISGDRFGIYLQAVALQGLAMEEAHRASLGAFVASGEATPMAAVAGPWRSDLDALLAPLNKRLGPSNAVHIGLQNGWHRHSLCASAESLELARDAIEAGVAKWAEAKKRGRRPGRVPSLTWEWLSVSGAFHSPYVAGGADRLREDLRELGFEVDLDALRVPVYLPDGEGEIGTRSDPHGALVECQFGKAVHWPQTLLDLHRALTPTLCLDFGPDVGVARLNGSALRGTGVRVVELGVAAGRKRFHEALGSAPVSWADFAPSVVRGPDGEVCVDNAFSRATGQCPIILPGMTPTTVDAGIVAAAANAGYVSELAGGGQVTEATLMRRVRELGSLLRVWGWLAQGDGFALSAECSPP